MLRNKRGLSQQKLDYICCRNLWLASVCRKARARGSFRVIKHNDMPNGEKEAIVAAAFYLSTSFQHSPPLISLFPIRLKAKFPSYWGRIGVQFSHSVSAIEILPLFNTSKDGLTKGGGKYRITIRLTQPATVANGGRWRRK